MDELTEIRKVFWDRYKKRSEHITVRHLTATLGGLFSV